MKKYSVITTFSFIVLILILQVSSQFFTDSPCPEVFEYMKKDDVWYGVITVRPPYPKNSYLTTVLQYDSPPPAGSHGEFETLDNNIITVNTRQGKNIRYSVILPIPNILPSVNSIQFNGNPICSGRIQSTDKFIATIQMNHTFESISGLSVNGVDYSSKDNSQIFTTFRCGKSNTNHMEWPWAVAVFQNKKGINTYQCGGTLVSKDTVITTGHCVLDVTGKNLLPHKFSVVVGLYGGKNQGTDSTLNLNIREIILHPNFDRTTLKNDISILKFQNPLNEFSDIYIAACLWWPSYVSTDDAFGEYGTVVGWAKDENRQSGSPSVTREKIVSSKECKASNPGLSRLLSSNTLCAGNRNGTGPCVGDSGNGLFFYIQEDDAWYLRGIVARSLFNPENPLRCNLDDYIVYEDITKYLPWIRLNVK